MTCARCLAFPIGDVSMFTACPNCGSPWPIGLQKLVGSPSVRPSASLSKEPHYVEQKSPGTAATGPTMPMEGPQEGHGAFLDEKSIKGAATGQNAPERPESRINAFSGPYAFLSNFWLVLVELDGAAYVSVEHAYQAAKSTDFAARESIRTARSPSLARRLGRRLTLRPDWKAVRLAIMADLLAQKFGKPALRLALLQTGEAELVESNRWHDTFYGKCYCDRCEGKGRNHLGRLLMELRARLKGEPP